MTDAWVRTTLAPHVHGAYLILTRWPDGSCQQTVDVAGFVAMFSAVTNPTYANLVAADNGKGYTVYFDQWKAEKLIA